MDVHLFITRHLEEKVAAGILDQEEAATIQDFIFEAQARGGGSPRTYYSLYRYLVPWFEIDLLHATMADIYRARAEMDARKLKANTMSSYLMALRRFYAWLDEQGRCPLSMKELDKIKIPKRDINTRTASQMLTPDEVKRIIQAAPRHRDRAAIAILYEGGMRPSEVRTLTWGQVKFDQYGLVINTDVKTGKGRYIRLVWSRHYMDAWVDEYTHLPGKRLLPDEPVFVSLHPPHGPLTENGFKSAVDNAVQRSGLEKHVTPHLFRHSHVTQMIRDGTQDSIIKKIHWGTLRTRMLETYAHLADSDIDQAILYQQGIIKEGDKSTRGLQAIQCPHCSTINAPTATHCRHCILPLSEEGMATLQELIQQAVGSELYKNLMAAAEERLKNARR